MHTSKDSQPMISTTEVSAYFAPLLPWQQTVWQQLTERVNNARLPHGLLFAGMSGIGKRAFVWRFVAWLLCEQAASSQSTATHNTQGACGQCHSCQWLQAGTHPDLLVLPVSSLLVDVESEVSDKAGKKTSANNKKVTNTKASTKANTKDSSDTDSIKIDDIRQLQPFVNQGSRQRRICVIDHADTMTTAAANALLKTLEEPQQGIHLLLISDMPARLLPTIKSRVQQVGLQHIQSTQAIDFLQQQIQLRQQKQPEQELPTYSAQQLQQLVAIANGAPLAALALLDEPWYHQRQLWLTTWQALRSKKRSSLAASDYWQKQLPLLQFLRLSEVMLIDIIRLKLDLPAIQTDIGLAKLTLTDVSYQSLQQLQQVIDDIKQSISQNVQEKLGYDKLMNQLALI